MSDVPDIPLGGEQEAEPPASSQDTPTLRFRRWPGGEAPRQTDAVPTRNPHRLAAARVADQPPFLADAPPELVNHPRYRVVGVLGKGGMGTVYQAEHRVMKRAVALKVIGAHLVADATAIERFRREVEAAAKLSHPNIVSAYDAEQAGKCHFLVMELVDGVSLDGLLKSESRLPLHLACDFVRQAALGLQHAHEHGMVHRDIKPHNLMLTRKGQVKILDFGLARFASENGPTASLTENGELTGTPDFMAPEQAEDAHRADIRADIYSLGCTLYTVLTGQLPFPKGNCVEKVVGHMKKEPVPLTAFRGDLPSELVQVVGRMMAKDPAQRFQTPGEVAKALFTFRKTGETTGGPDSTADEDDELVALSVFHQEPPPAAADTPGHSDGSMASSREQPPETLPTAEEVSPHQAARRRPVHRWNRPPSQRGRALVVISVVMSALGFFGLGGLLIVALLHDGADDKKAGAALTTPSPDMREEGQGQVSIVSRDPHLQLLIHRGSKVFGTIGPNVNRQMTLPVGDYEMQVVNGAPEWRGLRANSLLLEAAEKSWW